MARQVSIYILCEPDETEEPRYAGQTVDLKRRYYEHVFKEIKTNLSNKRKQDWIRSLRDQGKLPLLKVLFVVDQPEADQAERQVIEDMKLNGYDLLNGPFKVFGMWKAGWRCNVLKKPKIERVPKPKIERMLKVRKVRKERIPKTPKTVRGNKYKSTPYVISSDLDAVVSDWIKFWDIKRSAQHASVKYYFASFDISKIQKAVWESEFCSELDRRLILISTDYPKFRRLTRDEIREVALLDMEDEDW